MKSKTGQKKWLWIVGSAALVVIVLVVLFLTLRHIHYNSPEEYIFTENKNEFLSCLQDLKSHSKDMESDFLVFQTDKGEITECLFYKENGLFGTTYQIYMNCEFAEADFEQEIERIAQLSCEKDQEVQKILHIESGFPSEAYVSIFEDGRHEYVLVNRSEKTIDYVYEQFSNVENGNIPEDKLYGDVVIEERNTENGYSMYLFNDEKGWPK